MPRIVLYNTAYGRKFEIALTNEISRRIQEDGMEVVPDLVKRFYKEKMKFRSEEARLKRRDVFERFINWTVEHGVVEIRIRPTVEEIRERVTRGLPSIREMEAEREIFTPEEIESVFDYLREQAGVYIIHEFPRPSFPGVPFRMMIDETGRKYFVDIQGREVGAPSIEELPVRAFVPEWAQEIKPFPRDAQSYIREIQLRTLKIDTLEARAREVSEEEAARLRRRIRSFRGWNTRVRRKL